MKKPSSVPSISLLPCCPTAQLIKSTQVLSVCDLRGKREGSADEVTEATNAECPRAEHQSGGGALVLVNAGERLCHDATGLQASQCSGIRFSLRVMKTLHCANETQSV